MNEDRKEKFIKKVAKTKEEAIRLAGVNRDAILMVTSNPLLMQEPIEEQKKAIHHWRNWLWRNCYLYTPDELAKKEATQKMKEEKSPKEVLGF